MLSLIGLSIQWAVSEQENVSVECFDAMSGQHFTPVKTEQAQTCFHRFYPQPLGLRRSRAKIQGGWIKSQSFSAQGLATCRFKRSTTPCVRARVNTQWLWLCLDLLFRCEKVYIVSRVFRAVDCKTTRCGSSLAGRKDILDSRKFSAIMSSIKLTTISKSL